MARQILRAVDRWRFERPLALVLAAAAGFAVFAMPRALFARVPVAGHMGLPGHAAVALLIAIACGILGYLAMRRPVKAMPVDKDAEPVDDLDQTSGLPEDRLLRLRRADRHPDAPPRAPIRASRDLGEPFMEVGASVLALTSEGPRREAILDGDYVEVEASVEAPVEVEASPTNAVPVADTAPDPHGLAELAMPAAGRDTDAASPAAATDPLDTAERPAPMPAFSRADGAAPRQPASMAAMMERLSAGIERRAGRPMAPTRDMRPALRDALDELNRLAARHR